MALPLRHPFIKKGDPSAILRGWELTGYSYKNTDAGKLYVSTTVTGGLVTILLYKDFARTLLVATSAASATLARAALTESNASGISGSVYIGAGLAQAVIELLVLLCTEEDLRQADDRLPGLLLENETTFADPLVRTNRQFYTAMQAKFPPFAAVGDRLTTRGGSPLITGNAGTPSANSIYLWALDDRGRFEIVGLANPEDYREWAVQWTLKLIWERKARGADDPMLGRAMVYERAADRLWKDLIPWIDEDQDKLPDRPPVTRSVRIGRG